MSDYIQDVRPVSPQVRHGWIETRLKDDSSNRLESYIKKSQECPKNIKPTLAGNVSHSYGLIDEDDWFLVNVLRPCIDKYVDLFDPLPEVKAAIQREKLFEFSSENFVLDGFWVNYQKQHEFNPMHTHVGLFSFVIWVSIPVEWMDQLHHPACIDSGSPQAGDFKFTYLSPYGDFEHYAYNASKDLENTMLLFPSKLNHSVNPFYNSDEHRVSVSGNLILKTK